MSLKVFLKTMLLNREAFLLLFCLLLCGCMAKEKVHTLDFKTVFDNHNYLLEEVGAYHSPSYMLVGRYGSQALKDFLPPSSCQADEKTACVRSSAYYVYSVTPLSKNGQEQPIKVAIFSHLEVPGKPESDYFMEVAKLPRHLSSQTGVDYLVIGIAEIGSDYFCSDAWIHADEWLHRPPRYPERLQVEDDDQYCYQY